jgi:hypothetical protein
VGNRDAATDALKGGDSRRPLTWAAQSNMAEVVVFCSHRDLRMISIIDERERFRAFFGRAPRES